MYLHLTSLCLSVLLVSALPEPATLFQHQHPNQVGFVIPPNPSPPYGKSLPSSTFSANSRQWDWKHWLTDAKSAFKSLVGKPASTRTKPKHGEDDRNVGRFDNDIVLRINITSLADRIAITELAEVAHFM